MNKRQPLRTRAAREFIGNANQPLAADKRRLKTLSKTGRKATRKAAAGKAK
jgi:hypothetical protein